MSGAEKAEVLDKVASSGLPKRRALGELGVCWQPAKVGQSETREIRDLIEV